MLHKATWDAGIRYYTVYGQNYITKYKIPSLLERVCIFQIGTAQESIDSQPVGMSTRQ